MEEVSCYDSDGSEPPFVDENEFKHFEISLDENIGSTNIILLKSSKCVWLTNEAIDD